MKNPKEFIKKFMSLKQGFLTECLLKDQEETDEYLKRPSNNSAVPPYFTEEDSADIDGFDDEDAGIIAEEMWGAIEKTMRIEHRNLGIIYRGWEAEPVGWWITVPYLYARTCPFCILSELNNRGVADCNTCQYGKRHVICDRWAGIDGVTSDYNKNSDLAKYVRARKSMSSTNEGFRQAVTKLLKDYPVDK